MNLALVCAGTPNLALFTRLRWDASLYHPPVPRGDGQRGPTPGKGTRQRSLKQWATRSDTPCVRFAQKGHTPGEDVYAAFGQTFGGRYLAVFFVYKPGNHTAIILSAPEMRAKNGELMAENNRSSISREETLEQIGEFWDTHDFTDYDDPTRPDVEITFSAGVAIEAELFAALDEQAARRGVTVETLVNFWLQQKLAEQMQLAEAEIAA